MERRSAGIGTSFDDAGDRNRPTLMELTGDTAYQIVRALFAISLVGFLLLVIRITLRELQQPAANSLQTRKNQLRAELVTMPADTGTAVPDGLVFEIQGVTTLGRAESAKVLLEDSSVSAHHALLRPAGDVWTIEDLGSRNGTLVNGRQFAGQHELECGDSIQLGRVQLRLMC
ncbi:MAG: FHA domain-containing protein [Thermomicrobiales bacterium]|nr:FHA domain-containing protein [Thermomicrobiales bacterium]MCO5221231.1 FHA domain-containing protein [Thermomicrobiales bacterium]